VVRIYAEARSEERASELAGEFATAPPRGESRRLSGEK